MGRVGRGRFPARENSARPHQNLPKDSDPRQHTAKYAGRALRPSVVPRNSRCWSIDELYRAHQLWRLPTERYAYQVGPHRNRNGSRLCEPEVR